MHYRLNEETRFWLRLAAFASLSEQILCSGAPLADAEELLFGWQLPGDLNHPDVSNKRLTSALAIGRGV